MLLIFLSFHSDSERLLSYLDGIFSCPYPVISPTLSTIFDPSLVRKFMRISNICLFVVMFGFTNRLVVVPLSIIIIYIKYDPSFVTFLLPWKLICNPLQPLFFVMNTLTSASLSTVFPSLLADACWLWLCTFPFLPNHWCLYIVSLISRLFKMCIPEPQQ